MIIMWFTFMMI